MTDQSTDSTAHSRPTDPRLICLPGLGADARLFAPQLRAFNRASVPPWIEMHQGESIGAYAERFAETIETESPYALLGFSFGGMVALEIANRLPVSRKPRLVILIGGIRSRRAVTNAFRFQQALGTRIPAAIARPTIARLLAPAFAKRDRLPREHATTLKAMAAEIDLPYLFRAARACASWDFNGRVPVPVRHIHGRRDRIIPYKPHPDLPGGNATLIDAGHLITWSASENVNRFIRAALDEHAPEAAA